MKTHEVNVMLLSLLFFSVKRRYNVKIEVGITMNVARHVNFRHQNISFNNHEITCNSCIFQLSLRILIDILKLWGPNPLRYKCGFVISINHNPFYFNNTPRFKLF